MDPEQTSPSVFISYATSDRERAFEICRHLEDMGHSCWIAPRNIRAGHDYGEEIIRGIERSRCFVLVFSSAANKSIYVKRELERAVSKAKPVFPVRLEDVLPAASLELHLASLHYLDAWNGVLRDHIASLARALSGEGNEGPYRSPPPAPPPPWWRHRMAIGAVGAGAIALGVLAWWRQAPTPGAPVPQGVVETGAHDPAAAPVQGGREQGAGLSGCRVTGDRAPLVRCTGAPIGSNVHVRTAQGDETVIPAGSGADSFSGGGIYRRSTYLPWVGPGSTARVEMPGGVLSNEEPLPGAPDLAAAVPVPSLDSQAPPLFYAWVGTEWSYAFFAPMDTMEVDWSIDGAAPVRKARTTTSSGPFSLGSHADDTKKVTVRWRNQAGEWSEPSDYRMDVPAARLASVKPLQDLVSSIACYRVLEGPMPLHLRCNSKSAVPLGYLFEDLRWGTDASDLRSVDGFDFRTWATDSLIPRSGQPAVAVASDEAHCGSNTACLYRVRSEAQNALNQQLRNRRALESRIESVAGVFTPWREAESVVGSGVFVAMLPVDGDVHFEAVPQGGGDRLTARINVADHGP